MNDVVFRDTTTESKLRAEIRREIIAEIREQCGNCSLLRELAQERHMRTARKVRGVYRG